MNSQMLEAAGVSPGWLAVAAIGVAVVSYFLGCFNGAVVVSRYILRDDIREHGSGNAGLSNFYRVFGGPLTAAVILSDVVKAVLAVLFAVFIAGHISPELIVLSRYWAGAFCVIGHMYPCTFQFRGGKGVLSGGALAVMVGIGGGGVLPSWIIPVVALGGFIALAASTKYISLGSCWGGASFIITSWLVYRDPLILLLAAVAGGLLLWKHRGNMVRVVKGTESKFVLHGGSQSKAAKVAAAAQETGPQPEAQAVDEPAVGAAPEAESIPAEEAAEDEVASQSEQEVK
ncbi:MAG: glycerol-3-phosphate acyltransferase [Oscillospiraceae bacterium]|nr:glycerol-3-phosphate acyltransferase [Oscillospiraceae bacterium]MDE7170606.1 glycerol-3-phosphate acyltransferase [Oscillospiraceae bacterium]